MDPQKWLSFLQATRNESFFEKIWNSHHYPPLLLRPASRGDWMVFIYSPPMQRVIHSPPCSLRPHMTTLLIFLPPRASRVTPQTHKVCSSSTGPLRTVTEGKVHHRLMSWWKLEQASCYLSLRPTFLGRRSIFIPNAEKLFFPLLLFPGNLEAPAAAAAARALGKTAADKDKNNYGATVFQRHFSTSSASLMSCSTFTSHPGVLISLCCSKSLLGFISTSIQPHAGRNFLLGLKPIKGK